eukprot:Tbor_TRINITY_DN5282_c2_g3::TRINITY_DN5282_c2_g3_i1::g.16563::m.16563
MHRVSFGAITSLCRRSVPVITAAGYMYMNPRKIVNQQRYYNNSDNVSNKSNDNINNNTTNSNSNTNSNNSISSNIIIETSETPNPNSLRFFSSDLSFLPSGHTVDFPNSSHAYKSPFAEEVFKIPGVKGLFLSDEYITITKESTNSNEDWDDELIMIIKECILAFVDSGKDILTDEVRKNMNETNDADTAPSNDDSEVVLAIKELLATRIRPMVQGDGGNVKYIDFDEEDGTVLVMLEGACKTCPSSGVTLKNGIERMLMHWIPEVQEVQEVDEEYAADVKLMKEQRAVGLAAAEAAKRPYEPAL